MKEILVLLIGLASVAFGQLTAIQNTGFPTFRNHLHNILGSGVTK